MQNNKKKIGDEEPEEHCDECAVAVSTVYYMNVCRRTEGLDCDKIHRDLESGKITAEQAKDMIKKKVKSKDDIEEIKEIDKGLEEYRDDKN